MPDTLQARLAGGEAVKYKIIYADPPWRYGFSKSNSRKIENQYPTMTDDQICAIKVPAEDDSVLFLWATAPKIELALRVMRAWGFQYKTQAIWDKEIVGMGYWFRGQHEILMVGTRGTPKVPLQADRRSSVFKERRGRHSAKPQAVRSWIEKAYPLESKMEMFAREAYPGWDRWGNQVKSNAEMPSPEPEKPAPKETK